MGGNKMSDSDELKNLREKHADVLNNPAVDSIVNWQEPILGDERPLPTTEQMRKSFKIFLDKR